MIVSISPVAAMYVASTQKHKMLWAWTSVGKSTAAHNTATTVLHFDIFFVRKNRKREGTLKIYSWQGKLEVDIVWLLFAASTNCMCSAVPGKVVKALTQLPPWFTFAVLLLPFYTLK